jgi:Recombination endonuclease VII
VNELPPTKKCRKSGTERELTEFSALKNSRDGRRSQCKSCDKEYRRKHREENQEKEKERDRKWYKENKDKVKEITLLRKYGLTLGQYNEILKRQKNRCACCGDKLVFGDCVNPKRPCVHHSHDLGHTNDILCNDYNTAEGFVRTPERAQKLADYMGRDSLFYSVKSVAASD